MVQPEDNVDADFADLEIGHAVTVKGGCLKKEELLETRRTRCGKTFVKLDKTAPWLSRVVTGKAPCGRPLARTNIIEFMRAQLQKCERDPLSIPEPAATDDPDDPMAAMDYDDMEHASAVAEPAPSTVVESRASMGHEFNFRVQSRHALCPCIESTRFRCCMPVEPK